MSDAAPATADIVVGLVAHQDAENIGVVAKAARQGLDGHCAGLAGRVVLVDTGFGEDSAARAREALGDDGDVLETSTARTPADLLDLPYHGIPGKARALSAILARARELGARACVVLDAGVVSVEPQWVEWLTRPIIAHDFDLVSAYYYRHPYEGALTKGLVYPLVRALYGARLRQPAAAEFACSARLLDRLLDEDLWEREGAHAGIDLWLATAAASGDFRLAEAALGVRTGRARGEAPLGLGTTVTQVVGALFGDLGSRVERWQRVRGSVPVQQFGEPPDAAPAPGGSVDPERLIEQFRLGYRELRDLWTWVLPPRTIVDLARLIDVPVSGFRLEDELWARIVYDFALGYRLRVLARDHLLRSLVPLYLGWLASFVLQVRDLGPADVDLRVERLCAAFEAQKPYLISKWRWPERLRT